MEATKLIYISFYYLDKSFILDLFYLVSKANASFLSAINTLKIFSPLIMMR